MRPLLAAPLLLLAAAASANPMLDKCLPFAPAACSLSEKSAAEDFMTCFDGVKLDAAKDAQASCAEELSHARVHKACNAVDIPKVCAGVKPGENRVMGCLRKHKKELGEDCRKALRTYDELAAPKGKDGERKKGRHGGVAATRC